MAASVVDRWRARSRRGGRDAGHTRVALDATPLLGTRTGVGVFTACALDALAVRDELSVAAFAVSWRTAAQVVAQLPPRVDFVDRPMPARPTNAAWRWTGAPAIEWWTGPVDVVHGTNYVVPPARHAARVVTVHDLAVVRFPELCQPATLAYPGLLRRAIGEGAFVHTPSEFVAREVVELLGASPERVQAIAHGVPPVGRSPAGGGAADAGGGAADTADTADAPRRPVAVDGRFILAVGTVEPRKDYPTLVAAFDRLAADRPDLRLVIVGPDGWGSAALQDAIGAARHGDRIARLGWIDNAERDALFAAAEVLAYPSIYEGFGLPPLEAMAAGIPVVATAAGALPEVLGAGAELVPIGDIEALATALAAIVDDEAARHDLARRGRLRAAEYSWERCAAGLSRLYLCARDAAR